MKVAMAAGTVAGQEKPGFTPPSIEELARKFPQLEIIELIGRGGMGAVYILLDRHGRVKVADFGLAKLVGIDALTPSLSPPMGEGGAPVPGEGTPASALTVAGKIMGTPAYMAPEQASHPAEVDHRADIYALGVVFYQMLTGELPGKTIEPPSRKVHIDVRLDEVVLRALEKKPELRYQQVSEVKTMVETIAATPRASNESAPNPQPSTQNRNTQNMNANTNKSFWRGTVISVIVVVCLVQFDLLLK
jgi:serine/threonine protein kinase